MTSIKRTNSDDPDFQKLTQALDVELCRIYNTQQADYEEFNRITDLPTVVLAYEDDIPVGCGCFKKYDDTTIEIKRMYVEPGVRGKGIASQIVNELETWALELKNILPYSKPERNNRKPSRCITNWDIRSLSDMASILIWTIAFV
jgi:putative acetyltransferase